MEQTDYYAVLQVEPNATYAQIRLAYKRLALAMHPDLSAHPYANRQMQLLNEAYAVLGSAEKRAEYDRQLNTAPAATVYEDVWIVEWPEEAAPPAAPPAPTRFDLDQQRAAERRRQRWLQRQLRFFALGVVFTLTLGAWSLFTGQFNLAVILLLLIPVVFVIITLFRLVLGQIRG